MVKIWLMYYDIVEILPKYRRILSKYSPNIFQNVQSIVQIMSKYCPNNVQILSKYFLIIYKIFGKYRLSNFQILLRMSCHHTIRQTEMQTMWTKIYLCFL